MSERDEQNVHMFEYMAWLQPVMSAHGEQNELSELYILYIQLFGT